MQHVVAAIIYNSQGEILLARRPFYTHQGGLWEFPGGKCEKRESAEQALARELEEELGLIVLKARPLIRITHTYPEKEILLEVWHVEQWQGQAGGREGQRLQWCQPNKLKNNPFPPANGPIITAVQLPSLYLITPDPISFQDRNFFYHLETSLNKGLSLIQLRAKNLSKRDYCYCAEKALMLCEPYGARLLVNHSPEIALSVGAQGVHLNSQRLTVYTQRPLTCEYWVAASCHSLAEIQHAQLIGADFIVLSPVCTTYSHPDSWPLGWFKFFQLTEQAKCPVFALGGMQVEDVSKAWAHGAQGIAAIRGLWD